VAAGSTSDDRIRTIATGLSMGRILIGIVAILAPGLARRVMSLPAQQDNASVRMVTWLFGVREIAVGMHVVATVQESPRQPHVYAHNAAVDAGDAAVMLITLARGGGVRRPAVGSLAVAVPVVATWLWLRQESLSGDAEGAA
jgi:uncharacterized protein YjeT (DUF2065 family)